MKAVEVREERENVNRYLEGKMVGRMFNKLLELLLLEMPPDPLQYLMDELRNESVLIILAGAATRSHFVDALDFCHSSIDDLKAFSQQRGTKILNNFEVTAPNIEVLRKNKIYYDHLLHTAPLRLDLPVAVFVPTECVEEALGVG